MPGLIGFLKKGTAQKKHLEAARRRLQPNSFYGDFYGKFYVDDAVFENEFLLASRTHLGLIGEQKTTQLADNQQVIWVEGEAYNLQKLGEPASLAEALGRAAAENRLEKLLAELDGYFAAVIFDSSKKEIKLITDRLGMKPLYFWKTGQNFGWASEAKAFLEHPDFEKQLDLEAGKMILDLGQLVGDATWFEDVKLTDAATILTYSIDNQQVTKHRYWHWSKIRQQKMSFSDAADAVGDVFEKVVRARFSTDLKTAVSLSGGLDSRAILAALSGHFEFDTFSYGEKNCLDLRLAERAAAVAEVPNFPLLIDSENWMRGRRSGVIQNDGQYTWLHLHWTPFRRETARFELNLSGFAGDLILGGGSLRQNGQRADLAFAQKKFGRWAEKLNLDDPFFDFPSQDAFTIDSRVRRFTRSGSVEMESRLAQRKPFLANDLVELAYSLPDDFRRFNRLYSEALLRKWPLFFRQIEWAKTGLSIAEKQKTVLYKALKIRQLQARLGLFDNDDVHYSRLTRTQKSATFFRQMLEPKTAIYPTFFAEDFSKKWLDPHLEGCANFSEKIGRAVALETWLRFIFAPEKLISDEEA